MGIQAAWSARRCWPIWSALPVSSPILYIVYSSFRCEGLKPSISGMARETMTAHRIGHVVRFERVGRSAAPSTSRVQTHAHCGSIHFAAFFCGSFFFAMMFLRSFTDVTIRPADPDIYSRSRQYGPFCPADCLRAADRTSAACRATSSGMTLIRRRVSGFMVVIHIISGSFSPRPFERLNGDLFALELLENLALLLLGIGKPRLVLAADLIKRRLGDIDIALAG